jgi:hypothetical protein
MAGAETKWEYAVFEEEYESRKTPNILDLAGNEGWEAVGMAIHDYARKTVMIVLCKRQRKV